jgi:hypothetical protein
MKPAVYPAKVMNSPLILNGAALTNLDSGLFFHSLMLKGALPSLHTH